MSNLHASHEQDDSKYPKLGSSSNKSDMSVQFSPNSRIYTYNGDQPVVGKKNLTKGPREDTGNAKHAPLLKENQVLKYKVKQLSSENEEIKKMMNQKATEWSCVQHTPNNLREGREDQHKEMDDLINKVKALEEINRSMGQDLELAIQQRVMYKEELHLIRREEELLSDLRAEVNRLNDKNETLVQVLQGEIHQLHNEKKELECNREKDQLCINSLRKDIEKLKAATT